MLFRSAAEPADLVIMNPPFTRDSLRHDQFSPAHEKKIKDREKRLFANKPVHLSGNSGTFLVLADFINKADSGSIAAVLPLVSATAYSGLGIRQFLAGHYHVETIVTSHDPERIYFSENTSIGEMLLICRRWPAAPGPKPPTRVINLARNPATPADALNIARSIVNGTVATQGYGSVQEWPEDRIAAGDWGAVQFLAPNLSEKFVALRRNEFFQSIALGQIADIGPAGQGIRGVFDRSALPNVEGMLALWHHNTDVTQGMAARPDTHIVAKRGKERSARNLWNQRGRLLLPTRLFLMTTRVISARLDAPGLGSAWVPCKPVEPSPDWEKAMCVYLNSSVGILSILGDRSNRKPTYPNLSIDDLRKLVVPDFAKIGRPAVAQLAAAYDANAELPLRPLPQLNDCPVRRALDAAVIAALDLDGETVASLRRQLALEPSVTGRRYAGPAG